jgi:hypothetical protein
VAYSYPTITEIILNSAGNGDSGLSPGTSDITRYFFFTPINGIPLKIYWSENSSSSSSHNGDVSVYAYWADTGVEIPASNNHDGVRINSKIDIPANNGGVDVILKAPVYSSGKFIIRVSNNK